MTPSTPSAPNGAALLRDFALRANRGVELTRSGEHGLLARPLTAEGGPAATAPAVLPLVPARMLEQGCAFLRHVWRMRRASAVWSLYADPLRDRWLAQCPPQLCAEAVVEADGTFRGCPPPDPDLWLAGSLRSVPPGVADDATQVIDLLPAHQGVHFVLDLGRPPACLRAFMRTATAVVPHPLLPLVDDPPDPSLAYLSDRLIFRTRA